MNELKDGRLLTGIRIHNVRETDQEADRGTGSANINSANLNLEFLADQLAMIAAELRQTDRQRSLGAGSETGRSAQARLDEQYGTQSDRRGDFGSPVGPLNSDHNGRAMGVPDPQSRRTSNAATARQVYDKRRKRAALFGNSELFGEPAWDILLDLYIAHAENKPVSVSSACIGSAAPPTTGLRWLGVLAENELILREHDPEDQRRVLVRLTDRGIAAMDKYFSGAGVHS